MKEIKDYYGSNAVSEENGDLIALAKIVFLAVVGIITAVIVLLGY